ncbi:hypothetical protein CEP52_014851 [Fusarium oligoseptatum]|uniref:Uncharacterized protein n=1 Tax=Fusarium oligoseptatum TaxID=2604345 RepID=A0A428SIN9_9HYPO|nr:hypothetical protein CEP52_014851 [Fusarium oligoseptatum]
MYFTKLLPVVYFAAHGLALGGISQLCTWEPMLPVKAGSPLSVKIENPWGERCRAELEFSDDKFPKMAWSFSAIDCVDLQLAEFVVPSGAPNGDAYLTWQCDGDSPMSCIHIVISNSEGGPVFPSPQPKLGTARCVPSTTLLTRTVDDGKPTGIFLDTRLFNPTSASRISTLTSVVTPGASTPTTSTKPWIQTPGHSSSIGTDSTHKAGGTGISLPTDASTITTPMITTTATVTIPRVIPIDTLTDTDTTTTIPGFTTTIPGSTTTVTTARDTSANQPSYVTITTTVSACPTPRK